MQSFDFEAYQVGTEHFVIILRDKLSGIPAGPGALKPFPYEDHPPLPPSIANVPGWLSYLINRFSLRKEDVAMVLPIHDSGQHSASADYDLFTENEKTLWNYQLVFGINRLKLALGISSHAEATPTVPPSPDHITFNLSGSNSRVTINSSDNSVNVVNQTPPEVFEKLLEAIRSTPNADAEVVTTIIAAVEDMQKDYGTDSFLSRYQAFMSVLSDHLQVFSPVVAPYLPTLAKLLSSS